MNSPKTKNLVMLGVVLAPLIIDGIHIIVFKDLNEFFLLLLNTPSKASMWLLLSLYGLYISAIFIVGLLKAPKHKIFNIDIETLTLYLSAGFAVIIGVLVMHTLGLASNTSVFEYDFMNKIILITLLLCLLQIVIPSFRPKAKYSSEKYQHLIILIFTSLICALTINLSVAAWKFLLGSSDTIADRPWKWIDMTVAYPLFLIFFASPRFMFMSKNISLYSISMALITIGYFVLESLNYVTIF